MCYFATLSDSLKDHKRRKHEVVRYPCDECSYVVTQSGDLKQRKKKKTCR